MKVLFAGRYNESEILTGPEKVAKRIYSEYVKENQSLFVEYFFDGNQYSIIQKLFGIETVLKKENSEVLRMGAVKFLILLFKYKPDVIHLITFERFALICMLYKLFSQTKIIYNVHGIIAYEQKNQLDATSAYKIKNIICEKIYFKYSNVLVFLSNKSLSVAKQFYLINENKIVFIPNGIDYVFQRAAENKIINVSGNLKFVFTGDFNRKEKGMGLLLEAISVLDFNFDLYIISKRFEPGNEEMIKNNIFIVDRMDTNALAEFFKDKDVFISPGFYEQFSISTAEAMASGLVPVVTEETGISEYIEHGINGFVFGYGNKQKFAEILKSINDNRELLKSLSIESKKMFNQLSWNTVFEKYKKLYE